MRKECFELEKGNFLFNIKWLRNHYGLSKRRMAEIMGISVCSINRIERGTLPKRLNVAVIFNIQAYFNIPPKTLLEQRLGETAGI